MFQRLFRTPIVFVENLHVIPYAATARFCQLQTVEARPKDNTVLTKCFAEIINSRAHGRIDLLTVLVRPDGGNDLILTCRASPFQEKEEKFQRTRHTPVSHGYATT